MFKRLQRCIPLFFLAVTVLSACGGTSASSPSQTLRVLADPTYYGPSDLGPHTFGESGISRLLWAPLVAHDANYNITSTGLAPAPDVSSNGLTYTFHLRSGAKYSDGSPITAQDVSFDWRYEIMTGHPKIKGTVGIIGSSATRYWSDIVGAAAVFNGDVTPDAFNAASVAGIVATDTSTLQVTLTHPDPGFLLNVMVDSPSAVKPSDIQGGEGQNYSSGQYWETDAGNVFSGPFTLASYTYNQGMTLKPNPDYYGAKPTLQEIAVTFVKDHATAITAFQNKQADWLDITLSAADVQNAETDSYLKSTLMTGDTDSVEQLYITPYPPLDDVHVRRAIAMAIDKQALVNVLGGGAGQTFYKPLNGHVANPGDCNNVMSQITPLAYNPTAAKAELALSSYGSSVTSMPIYVELGLFGEDITTDSTEMQFIQQALQTNLGFKNIQIRQDQIPDFNKVPYPYALWPNEQGNRDPNLYAFVNNLAPSIPTAPIPASGPSSFFNLPYVPQVTQLMAQAAAATTLTQQCSIMQQVLQAWADNVVTLDLYTNNGYTMVAPWVKNLHTANGEGGVEYLYLSPGIEDTSIASH